MHKSHLSVLNVEKIELYAVFIKLITAVFLQLKTPKFWL
jgi:hypothetical protein